MRQIELCATFLATLALAETSSAALQGESWRYYRPGNTGIQGDYCEAIWIGADDDPYIAGYQPFWEDGGFAKFVQAENRWENWSTVDYPEIGDRALVGAARIHDITEGADGKLWMATWRALVEFDPAVGASSLKRWDSANSPHPGGRTMDVEVAPDGSVWATVFGVSWGTGGLLRFEPSSQVWSLWDGSTTANGWPSGTVSCDELAVQPKPAGGYTVWIKADNTGRMITFDSTTQTFTQVPITGAPGEVRNLAGHDSVDDIGNLWASRIAPSGGFATELGYRRPDGTWVIPPQVGVGADGFKALGDTQAVAADGNNVVWRFNGVSWQNLGQWKTSSWTYAVDMDSAGNVWAAGIGGAAKRDEATGLWQRYRITNTSAMDYFTRDVSLDGLGGLWMTGNSAPGVGGFQHFDGTRWFNFNIYTYGLGGPWNFNTDNVDAITVRAGGTGVVLNPMFNGIHEWTGSQYVDMQGMGTSDGLVEDSLGRIWSVGNYYSLEYHDGTEWTSVPIAGWGSNVQKDPAAPGMIWAVANFEVVRTDGTYRFSRLTNDFPELNPMNDTLTSVAAAPGGIAWVGSTDGLFRVDPGTGTHQWFHPSNSAIPGNQITPMAVTPDGRVWFTNFGNQSTWPDRGLGWFDGQSFGYYPQTQVPDGLPHAQIADMEVRLVPGGYELWLSCTSEGVAVLTILDDGSPTVYCTAKTNSLGCVPQIGSTGTLSVADAIPFVVTAQQVLNQHNGLFFYGTTGRTAVPFLGGTLCANPPLRRTPIQNSVGAPPPASDCSGGYTFDFDAWYASGVDPTLVPGAALDGQFWTRDPAVSFGVGLTDAIEFAVTP